jgi:3-hydroxyisobutyrate dehydrogenase
MQNIAFIGLGHMGNPMATRLLDSGFSVKVFDISDLAVNALVAKGAKTSRSVIEAVKEADVIFTMLQTGKQVSDVCLGNDGLFVNSKPEVLYIDCSSIDILTTRNLHYEAGRSGVLMLDAPVSGGVSGALAGTLTIMVGGEERDFKSAKPVLEKLGKVIVHAGEAGHGQAAKICNNLILGISMIAVSEGFNLAKKLGLDAKKFFEISSNASGQCWSMTTYCPEPGIVEKAPSSHNYKAGFMAKMMLKDLRLGQHAAEMVNAAIPLGAEAAELYSVFVNQGNEEVDFSGIMTMIAGVKK